MKKYTFADGRVKTSKLTAREIQVRLNRLNWLRVLTEGYTDGEGRRICDKALKAYNKADNFTGIIRLTTNEKDFIGYMLASDMNSEHDIEVLSFYLR